MWFDDYVISGYVVAQEGDPYVSVDITQNHAHPGDDVTFSCRVSNPGSNTIAIYKMVVVADWSDKYEQVRTCTFTFE